MRKILTNVLIMLFLVNTAFADNYTYKQPVRKGAGMHIKLSSTGKTIATVSTNQRVKLRDEGVGYFKVITKGNTTQLVKSSDGTIVLTTKRVYIKKSRAWLNILYEPEGVAGIAVTLKGKPGFEHAIKPTKFFNDVRKSQEKKLKKAEKKLEKVKAKIGLDKIEATAKLKAVQLESKIDLEAAISNPNFDVVESTEVSKAINNSTATSVSKATEKAVQEATKDSVMTATQEATLAAAVEAVEKAESSFGDFMRAINDFALDKGYDNLGSEYEKQVLTASNNTELVHMTNEDLRVFTAVGNNEVLRNSFINGEAKDIIDFANNELDLNLDQAAIDVINKTAEDDLDGIIQVGTGPITIGTLDHFNDDNFNINDLDIVGRAATNYINDAGEIVAHIEVKINEAGEEADIISKEGEPQ